MQISVCPDCYKKGKLIEGKSINVVSSAFGSYYLIYWCKECKNSYKEISNL
jgi:hypothetical protein